MKSFFIAVAALTISVTAAFASGDPAGQWTDHWAMNLSGAMKYRVYVPKTQDSQSYDGIILGLHGCKETAADFAALTHMTDIADQHGVILVFPEQSTLVNSDHCWNWFESINQGRDTGEPSLMMTAFNETLKNFAVNRAHAYVLGISSGAAMANTIASCNPDVFSGAAILSGLEYAYPLTSQDLDSGSMSCPLMTGAESGDLAYGCSGLKPHALPNIILFHGDQDPRVLPCNSNFVFDQWVRMAQWADELNGAITSSVEISGKQAFTQKDLTTSSGWKIRQITVHGMAHAWSGGTAGCFAADPDGPDATSMIWDFFTGESK